MMGREKQDINCPIFMSDVSAVLLINGRVCNALPRNNNPTDRRRAGRRPQEERKIYIQLMAFRQSSGLSPYQDKL